MRGHRDAREPRAEVGDADLGLLPEADEDVRGLERVVHQLRRVGGVEHVRERPEHRERLVRRERALRDRLRQRRQRHALRDAERRLRPRVVPGVDDARDEVGRHRVRDAVDLLHELHHVGALADRGVEHLHRDLAAVLRAAVIRVLDEAPVAEHGADLVAACDEGAGREHGRGHFLPLSFGASFASGLASPFASGLASASRRRPGADGLDRLEDRLVHLALIVVGDEADGEQRLAVTDRRLHDQQRTLLRAADAAVELPEARRQVRERLQRLAEAAARAGACPWRCTCR